MVAQFTKIAGYRRCAWWLCVSLACVVAAHVQADDVYGAEAKVARSIVAAHGEDPTASGTTLSLDGRATPPRSLAEVLRESPGAQVMQTGGMGAHATLSLRGADDNETLVLLHDIPLLTPDGAAFDLSFLPVEWFERIEVLRGAAPAWLNAGAIGGVVRLVAREAERTGASATLSAGSFGSFQAAGSAEVESPQGLSSRSSVMTRGTRGDYPYLALDLPYAHERAAEGRRENAEFLEAHAYQDLTHRTERGKLRMMGLGTLRTGGFPGPGAKPTPQIHRRSERVLTGASYELNKLRFGEAGLLRLQLVAAHAYGRERYSDVYGQLGVSRQTLSDDDRHRVYVRLAASARVRRGLEISLVSSYIYDAYRPENRLAYLPSPTSSRHTLAGALELAWRYRVLGMRGELRPSGRVEVGRAELFGQSMSGAPLRFERAIVAPTARLGAALELTRGVALSGSVGTGLRLPSLYELFGDRAMVLPNPELSPVRSETVDLGVTARRQWGVVHALLEVRAFHQRRFDSIAMYRTAQWQVGHENLSQVSQSGAETGLQLGLGSWLMIYAAHTFLDSSDALGRRLPLRARHVSSLRPEFVFERSTGVLSSVRVSSELFHRSFSFVDLANSAYVEGCLKLAASVAFVLRRARLRMSARVDDLADARCTDVVGYPLPGRSMFFSIGYRES